MGQRLTMEDRHVVVREGGGVRPSTFCGVYDGHGGAVVARLAAEMLHDAFLHSLREGTGPREAFVRAYAVVAEAASVHALTGTTACTAWITDSDLTVAWVGDSQLALVTPAGPWLVTPAHRATEPGELARIRVMGGEVEGPYLMRGQHGVMVARAFGDTWFHPVGLVATPSIVTAGLPRAGTPYLVVLATDGLWDVVRPEAVADLFRECLQTAEGRASDYARLLVDLALTAGSSDNVTVVTVVDLPDEPDVSGIVDLPPGGRAGVDQTRERAPLRDGPRRDPPAPGRSRGGHCQGSRDPAGSGPLPARPVLGSLGDPTGQGAPDAAQAHAGESRRHPGSGRGYLLRRGAGDPPPWDRCAGAGAAAVAHGGATPGGAAQGGAGDDLAEGRGRLRADRSRRVRGRPRRRRDPPTRGVRKAPAGAVGRSEPVKPGRPAARGPVTIWTIGHGTRPLEELVRLLDAHGVRCLADIRTVPRSRRNAQFNRESLPAALQPAGIEYVHLADLGGLRRARPDSINTAWRNASFRGYADYMQTDAFREALAALVARARTRPTAIMCAESVPWRCHRSLVADALTARGVTVLHILGPERAEPHAMTRWARVRGTEVTYPGEGSTDDQS